MFSQRVHDGVNSAGALTTRASTRVFRLRLDFTELFHNLTQWHVVKHLKSCTWIFVDYNDINYAVFKQVKIQHKWHWRGDKLSISCVVRVQCPGALYCAVMEVCIGACISLGPVNRHNHGIRAYGCQWCVLLYKQYKKYIYTIRQIQEAVINLMNQQAEHEAFHLYHGLRGKGLTSRAKGPADKIIKYIFLMDERCGWYGNRTFCSW